MLFTFKIIDNNGRCIGTITNAANIHLAKEAFRQQLINQGLTSMNADNFKLIEVPTENTPIVQLWVLF